MCLIKISKQTDPEWQLIIYSNRDETKDRKSPRTNND